jgi:serine kinase of HPr protein (carbohydrate metabolism regulator)
LALRLITGGACGLGLRFARLVADDRVLLEPWHGRLLVRAPDQIAGLLEVRGVGIQRLRHEAVAVVGLVVDLAHVAAPRLPEPAQASTTIAGIAIPVVLIPPGSDPMPPLLAIVTNTDWSSQLMKK